MWDSLQLERYLSIGSHPLLKTSDLSCNFAVKASIACTSLNFCFHRATAGACGFIHWTVVIFLAVIRSICSKCLWSLLYLPSAARSHRNWLGVSIILIRSVFFHVVNLFMSWFEKVPGWNCIWKGTRFLKSPMLETGIVYRGSFRPACKPQTPSITQSLFCSWL